VCSTLAVVVFGGFAYYGEPLAGMVLAVGLALGGFNGLLAARTADAGSFRLISLMRIGLLSAIALAVGLLVQPSIAWLAIAGVAFSQFVMSAIAMRAVLRS
jgi:hypothetical protein